MAEINNHMCGGGALVELDDLAFELVTRTELHYDSCVSRNMHGQQWRTLAYPSVWTSPTATASAPARSRSWRRYASRDRSPPRRGILVCRIGEPGFSSNRSTKACPSLRSPPRPEGPAAEALPLPRSASR